jgi:thymidylate synthase
MNWQADSFHIYGKDLQQAEQRLFSRMESTTFADRVYHMSDPAIAEMYHEEEAAILKKIAEVGARM